jgi:hypothetical protein
MADATATNPIVKAMSQYGTVTKVVSATVFESTLTNFGDEFFQSWYVYVVRKGTGTGAAPQGEKQLCSGYVSNFGRLTTNAFSIGLAVGDGVYVIHPYLVASSLVLCIPSNDLKQSSDIEASTNAAVLTLVKQLAFSGPMGGARISFDIRANAAPGTASYVIYKNGVAVTTNPTAVPIYTVYTDVTGVYNTVTQDVYGLAFGDLIQVYAMVAAPAVTAFIRNFRVSYDIISVPAVEAAIEMVYIDSVNGVAGTDFPIGTAVQPVRGWADAQTIAQQRNLTTFKLVHGVITLTANIVGYRFVGNQYADPGLLVIDNWILLSGFTASKCSFSDININQPGTLTQCGKFVNCGNVIATIIDGCSLFDRCGLIDADTLSNSRYFSFCNSVSANTLIGCSYFTNCRIRALVLMTGCQFIFNSNIYIGIAWVNCISVIDCNIERLSTLDFTGYALGNTSYSFSGRDVTITNFTAVGTTLDFSGDFTLTIAASCTAGTINVRGNIRLINNTGGATVNDYTVGSAISALGGMCYYGRVTAVPGANQFTIPSLAGLGNTKFVGWNAYVLWDAAGAGAAPQHEQQPITVYTSAGGVFTAPGFTAAVGIGDDILILNPEIMDALPAIDSILNTSPGDVGGNKGDSAVTVVGVVASRMGYIKGILNLINAMLTLKETGGTLLATAAEQNLVINNAPASVFAPKAVRINLRNMALGDVVTIRSYTRLTAVAGLELEDVPVVYNDVQAVPNIVVSLDPNRYGFKVTLQQNAGVAFRNFDYEYLWEDA